ncbi:MAG: BON domain-containing protein [Comamonadaceae bacterium]|nr:MAG: BON domain-containing protein [Comamonadaceae bacterium]
MPARTVFRPAVALLTLLLGCAIGAPATAVAAEAEAKRNWFDDPFFQVASGLPSCTAPEGPMYTEAERREQMHSRLERGTSCWLAGRCADSNAYRYDRPLAPRVRAALATVPGVRRGSVWVTVQRRWVYLQGCVPSPALAARLVRAARSVPDVETVVPDLMTGTRGKPPYPVAMP